MAQLSRRDFLQLSVSMAGTMLLPKTEAFATPLLPDDPHFFLLIILDGGADSSYMFDARPLAMTSAGLVQNYMGADPTPWVGRNGASTLASSLVKPLVAYRDRFSILNGVVMTPSFDGHLQNMNFLFCGNPFGGESFVPHLNGVDNGRSPDALDALLVTEPAFANVNNHSSVVRLMPDAIARMSGRLKQNELLPETDPLQQFITSRIAASTGGQGRMATGAQMMKVGLERSRELFHKLLMVKPPDSRLDEEERSIALLAECFRLSLTRSAIFVLHEQFDVHNADQAKRQPEMFQTAVTKIAGLLRSLIDTPFDSKRSMLDVTTFMVASEFGRTLRARGMRIDNTGTHHNQLANSILIGGKGIVGGLVVGSSDLATVGEKVSASHKALDPMLEKAMGRPFDFQTMRSRPDLPGAFQLADHLTIGSVVNTIYSLFGVPPARHRLLGRNQPVAPIVRGLLA